jgi:hypothetical protein
MPKKRKPFSNLNPDDELEFDPAEEPSFGDDDLDDDDDFDLADPSADVGGDFSLSDAEIIEDCGRANARLGLALFQRGAV